MQGERVTTCPDACARDGFTSCRRAPCSPEADEPTVIAMSGAAGPTWPLRFQDALITVTVTLVLAAGETAARSVLVTEANAWMQVDDLLH